MARQLRASQRKGNWVVAKELDLSYYIGETTSLTIISTHYGNLI